MKHHPDMTYSDQAYAWADEFGQTDRHEGLELYQMMVKTGELLELITGKDAANAAMISLYIEILAWHPVPAAQSDEQKRIENLVEADWRTVWWDDQYDGPHVFTTGDLELLPIAQRFTSLHSFAFGGIAPGRMDAPKEDELDQVRLEIGEYVSWGRDFLETVPYFWPQGEHIQETVLAADARYKLDELKEGITVDELAALGNSSPKNIRNILAKKDGTLVQEGGLITLETAQVWLAGRADFFPSVYSHCDGSGAETIIAEPDIDDAVFVPLSKTSGEPFTPSLQRGGTFTIGPKGAEIHVEDYFEALGQLRKMRVPKWRRPDPKGNWGLVSGSNNWRRMDRKELLQSDTI